MTFSAEQYQERIGKNETVPKRIRSYYQQRFQQQVFARLALAFAERADEFNLTKSSLAALMGKDKSQINRILSHPTNMTLDTLSEISLALNCEPTVLLDDLDIVPRHNYCHPAYTEYVVKPAMLDQAVATTKVSKFRVVEKV
jgi:antitoxin component HigA of HigAB toxin-antitoxin module